MPREDSPVRNGAGMWRRWQIRHWKADFGDAPPLLRGEYADDDHDGLPNWFEMYWFGKFLDWSTATVADPGTDPDSDWPVCQAYGSGVSDRAPGTCCTIDSGWSCDSCCTGRTSDSSTSSWSGTPSGSRGSGSSG